MSVMFRRAFTLTLSLDCKSQFRSPMRKCSTFSESNLPNNVLKCMKSSWGEFGGLYHEVITAKGFGVVFTNFNCHHFQELTVQI